MWFRKLKLKLLAGAYLTVIQLSTVLKSFWAFFFFWMAKLKTKSQSFFVCFHIPNVCQEHYWWHAAPQDGAQLSSYTIVLSKYRQMSQDCVQASMGMLSLVPVLAAVTVFVSMSTMWVERLFNWARAYCIQGHKHRHTQDCPGVLCQEMPQFGIWILYANLPLALHFRMPLCFVFASFILNGSREIRHLC